MENHCIFKNCKNTITARKLCNLHYKRAKTNGEFKPRKFLRRVIGHRKICNKGHRTIWLVQVCMHPCKYRPEHRVLMEQLLHRKLLDSEVVHHKDHNPLNNNLGNLMLMSSTDHHSHHAKEQWANGYGLQKAIWSKTGMNSPRAKLTDDLVREIRILRKNETVAYLSKKFKVDRSTISMICLRKAWKHIL